MVGPVLHQELLLGGRRNRLHVLRWFYAGWLVLQVVFFYLRFQGEEVTRAQARWTMGSDVPINAASAPEVVGAWFSEAFVSQQMLLLLLVTPAFVAGAITDEKRRGTLQYLLTSHLGTRDLLMGKLLGRLAQVALVALAGLPLFALLAGFGGVEPVTLLFVAGVLVPPVFAVASATLLASVWCRQTRDAVLGLYVLGGAGWLILWALGLLDPFNPLHVLAPVWGPAGTQELGEGGRRLLVSGLCWGIPGGACLALAVAQLRPAYVRELESARPTRLHWYSAGRPPVSDEAVAWRERHVEGLAPAAALRRVPQWLALTAVAGVSALSSGLILWASLLAEGKTVGDIVGAVLHLNVGKAFTLLPDAGPGFLVQSVAVMLLASLVVGIRCSGAVTGERERQTWEALLLTPLSARAVIRGKMWGIMGASYWYLLAYAAPAVLLSALGGLFALFWTLIWLAVTVLAMYFVGAAGLWCSVRSKNSWRSLLTMLVVGYVGGALIYTVTVPVLWVVTFLLLLILHLIDLVAGSHMANVAFNNRITLFDLFFIASCIGLAVIFWLMARMLLNRAQRWVADRERTRHWYDEPLYRRTRRTGAAPGLSR
jgi:ABC-type transport system involved in multi-copper enzyme maturation permease subunit